MKTMTQSLEQLLEVHVQAVLNGDMETLRQDYTEDSVFLTANGSFKGQDAIIGEFKKLLAAFPNGLTINPIKQVVDGENVLLVWSGGSDTLDITFAVDTFVIRDGKIMMQTATAQIVPKS
jgi:ketosteroid isomerase-like protein